MLIGINGKIGSGKDTVGSIIQGLIVAKEHNILNPNFEWIEKFHINSSFKIKKFADKLKEMVCLMIGCTIEQLEDRDFKEKELGEEWWYYTDTLFYNEDKKLIPYTDAPLYIKNSTKWYIIKLTPRLLLQLMGTECGRNIIHPNIWINALFADYKVFHEPSMYPNAKEPKVPNWIITDMRFPNEKKAIEDKDGITIRINRTFIPKTIKVPSYAGQAPKNFKEVPFDKNNPLHLKWNIKTFDEKEHHPSETALDNAEFDYVINNNGTIEELLKKVREILIDEKII